ncbi:hypothetical protein KR009_006088 [Drosophila setifemur]|nr:hypothetical protein KR009_006088 [Drosophila setifemur]
MAIPRTGGTPSAPIIRCRTIMPSSSSSSSNTIPRHCNPSNSSNISSTSSTSNISNTTSNINSSSSNSSNCSINSNCSSSRGASTMPANTMRVEAAIPEATTKGSNTPEATATHQQHQQQHLQHTCNFNQLQQEQPNPGGRNPHPSIKQIKETTKCWTKSRS